MHVATGPAAHSPRAGPGATDEAAALRRGRRGTRLAGSDSVAGRPPHGPARRARGGEKMSSPTSSDIAARIAPWRTSTSTGAAKTPLAPSLRACTDPFGAPLGYRAHDPAAFVLDFG